MHVCEEFRERITERILDHRDIEQEAEIQRELLLCSDCAEFHAESRELIDALSGVAFDVTDEQWNAMAGRLNARIHQDDAARRKPVWSRLPGLSPVGSRAWLPAFGAVAAMLLVMAGVYRLSARLIQTVPATANPPLSAALDPVADPDPTLDPVTVEFIEQSELLLRNVMNLKPNSPDDVEQAKTIAARQLIALDQRKQAAVDNQPVVIAMDKYENILREIRNISSRPVADDIADIQNRIERNGLIAGLKAFQPRINVVEADLGKEK